MKRKVAFGLFEKGFAVIFQIFESFFVDIDQPQFRTRQFRFDDHVADQ